MRTRLGVNRCCCGDKTAGSCPDACAYSWNSCAVGVTGNLYNTLADAYDNCGWRRTILPGFGFPYIQGSNGNFTVSNVTPNQEILQWVCGI